MRPEEIAALGDLASEAAAGATRQIQELHSGIAGRVWRRVGPAAIPVKLAHDRIARSAYAAAGELTRTVVRAGAQAASAARAPDSPSIERTPAGRAVVSALNGAFGDTLERNGNPLALTMSLRRRGRDLEITRESLAAAYPKAKPRLAVFVHGLCETDDAWNGIPARPAAHRVPYGHRMEIELGYSPLYLRYNTGRHISENGRELAGLLEDLVAAWPTEVHEVVLIGHSMGGLVSRSACHYGVDSKCVAKVRHVFTLGTPHRGAPLEQVTNAATAALARLPETRPLARALNLRSSGIKDLRYGYLVDECWADQDCDAYLQDTSREIPFLPSARHYFICATLSREADAPVGRIIGDLLVLQPSAWAHPGRGHRMQFPIEHYYHLGKANHFDLLNHPAIFDQMRRCLQSQRALPAPRVA
ncbi:MAG TPA: alpha/beta fold hydrolase [Solirubrobacteraceae bacterium]|jgi:pimeloyl-ACP methyl ester carboxylesterase|nr:alpha/beta fold hydrolase [Solirubrobacteraceae bacterium]